MLLQGNVLYVVENNLDRVAVIQLSADLLSGTVLGYLTSPALAVPTGITRFEDSIYVVNGAQGLAPPFLVGPPEAVRLPLDEGHEQ